MGGNADNVELLQMNGSGGVASVYLDGDGQSYLHGDRIKLEGEESCLHGDRIKHGVNEDESCLHDEIKLSEEARELRHW